MKVFISHSSKDKRFVRKLKDDLEENSIGTWLDEDELDVGDSLVEKLDEAIEESTHFIIILSQNSVESKWVKHELSNALRCNHKIIPIKYRECAIPEHIEGTLYLDISNETVERKGDKVEFVTDGYKKQLAQLIQGIKSSDEYKLNKNDKTIIQNEIIKNEECIKDDCLRIHLKIVGYTPNGNLRAIKKLKDKGVKKPIPVMLPPLFRKMNINIGDSFNLNIDGKPSNLVHLAGFRSDDLKICLPKVLRDNIEIENHTIHALEVDFKSKVITIL